MSVHYDYCIWESYDEEGPFPNINFPEDTNFVAWLAQFNDLFNPDEFDFEAEPGVIQDENFVKQTQDNLIRFPLWAVGVQYVQMWNGADEAPPEIQPSIKEEAEYYFKQILWNADIRDCEGHNVIDTLWENAKAYRNGYTEGAPPGQTVVFW